MFTKHVVMSQCASKDNNCTCKHLIWIKLVKKICPQTNLI